jgi:GT2 family glycosyltransferase
LGLSTLQTTIIDHRVRGGNAPINQDSQTEQLKSLQSIKPSTNKHDEDSDDDDPKRKKRKYEQLSQDELTDKLTEVTGKLEKNDEDLGMATASERASRKDYDHVKQGSNALMLSKRTLLL